ncbi:hypothetical protein BGZ47_010835 [Haplosporangium gracile]|nr:hypothetical protein BGZ47_010835 [Haplosporangium gracile]
MHFHTIIASTLLAVLSITASTVSAGTTSSIMSLSAASSKTTCQACVDKAVLDTKPSCKDITYLGNVDTIVFDKLSNKEKTCLCSMAASDDWYHSCERPDACDAEMMEMYDRTIAQLKAKVFCPNGGVFTDAAGGCVMPGGKIVAGLTVAATAVIGALV